MCGWSVRETSTSTFHQERLPGLKRAQQSKEPFWCSALRRVSIEAFPTAGSWRQRGMMYKYLRMVAMEKTRSPALRKMTDNALPKLAGKYPTCSNYLQKSTPSLSRPQNSSIHQERNKSPTLHSTPAILLPSYSLTEGYIGDFLATLTQNRTCSNTRALLLVHKPHKLGRK